MKTEEQDSRLRELEHGLRQEVLAAWAEFAKSDQSPEKAARTDVGDGAFWRYQRALKRLNDLILYGDRRHSV